MKKNILIALGSVMLLGATAAVASYVTHSSLQTAAVEETAPVRAAEARRTAAPQPQQQAAAPQQPACNDGNIVGTLAGGAAGGLLGHQIGKGRGNTVATIGGAVGGAVVGQKYIPTHNVTCR